MWQGGSRNWASWPHAMQCADHPRRVQLTQAWTGRVSRIRAGVADRWKQVFHLFVAPDRYTYWAADAAILSSSWGAASETL